ncbi:hypothetical protein VTJ04DRAFT_5130 [Mycothermus thermophilus]|uniref:uncharacterized protein n=1 Tax=Humicola insolens TaxID=85995 RepID=UPI0037432A76
MTPSPPSRTPLTVTTQQQQKPSPFPPATIPVTQWTWTWDDSSPSSSRSSSPTSTTFPDDLPTTTTTTPSLRLPTTWRCGACARFNSTLDLLLANTSEPPSEKPTPAQDSTVPTDADGGDDSTKGKDSYYCCSAPSLQAIYDQHGEIYLFWRDDPAVSDLRVPSMAEEARWRVLEAGGGGLLVRGQMRGVGK